MTAGSHVEPAADFTRYQTFDWGPPDALPTGDPRLDGNIFFRDHVMGGMFERFPLVAPPPRPRSADSRSSIG